MFGQNRQSLSKILGWPEAFYVILFTLALVVLLSPYLGGQKIGNLEIPEFDPRATLILHIVGPLVLAFVIFAFVPFFSTGRLVFEKIRVAEGNPYWNEWKRSSDGVPRIHAQFPKHLWSKCKQFFHINEEVSHADPSFDVTLLNNATRDITIYAVGVRVVRVAQYSYELPTAGPIREAREIETSKTYWLEMPNISQQTRHLDFDEDDAPFDVKRLVTKDCTYVLSPDDHFRYTLVLGNYSNVPNNAVLRMWVDTNEGERESHALFLRYALGF
jgi:hypothetical protein